MASITWPTAQNTARPVDSVWWSGGVRERNASTLIDAPDGLSGVALAIAEQPDAVLLEAHFNRELRIVNPRGSAGRYALYVHQERLTAPRTAEADIVVA